MEITITINGERKKIHISPTEKLLDVLRRCGYKSVKKGCETGNCGACVVLLDGKLVNSCTVLAIRANNREIITVEGLGSINNPHPIQEAFAESGAVQCGYCVPGSILATKALLDRNSNPSEEEIKEALDGNLCRCTGYVKRIEAVKLAAKKMRNKNEK